MLNQSTMTPAELQNKHKQFKHRTTLASSLKGKCKALDLVTTLDLIGKVSTHFEIYFKSNPINLTTTTYFDRAIEVYNKLDKGEDNILHDASLP